MKRTMMMCMAVGLAVFSVGTAAAQAPVLPLWPTVTPEPPQTTEPEKDVSTDKDRLISGHRSARITNVTQPTMTVYRPRGENNHAAALVFPGGGYVRLAWNGEGTDTCQWLNSLGMTCLLVKYRVPEKGRYPENFADLEDAQQAMRIARQHAKEWDLDPNKIGVVGFSAGGHLAVTLSTHWNDTHVESTPAASEVSAAIDARPDFAILGYPAYLEDRSERWKVDPALQPVEGTPPTFLIQAENDRSYIDSSLAYYRALKDAQIPAEMHLYATGGHGFGLHPVGEPEENWTLLADAWLRRNNMIPAATANTSTWAGPLPSGAEPCVPQPPVGRPNVTPSAVGNPPGAGSSTGTVNGGMNPMNNPAVNTANTQPCW